MEVEVEVEEGGRKDKEEGYKGLAKGKVKSILLSSV